MRTLLRPFARDGKSGFGKVDGDEAIVSRLEALISAGGELPWRPELDARIDRLRHQRNTPMLAQFARFYIQEILQANEHAVVLKDVAAVRENESLTLTVTCELAGRMLTASATL